MKKFPLLLIFLSVAFQSISQTKNYIYHGNKKYESTEKWQFEINGTAWDNYLEVTVAKDGQNGIIMLQSEVTNGSFIGGPIYIYLSDGSRIICADKNIKDKVDNKSIVLYKLTAGEINMMKLYYIASIRFSILPLSDEGFNGNKTADNKVTFSSGSQKSYHETEVAIKALFNN